MKVKDLLELSVGETKVFFLENPMKLISARSLVSYVRRSRAVKLSIKADFNKCSLKVTRES